MHAVLWNCVFNKDRANNYLCRVLVSYPLTPVKQMWWQHHATVTDVILLHFSAHPVIAPPLGWSSALYHTITDSLHNTLGVITSPNGSRFATKTGVYIGHISGSSLPVSRQNRGKGYAPGVNTLETKQNDAGRDLPECVQLKLVFFYHCPTNEYSPEVIHIPHT